MRIYALKVVRLLYPVIMNPKAVLWTDVGIRPVVLLVRRRPVKCLQLQQREAQEILSCKSGTTNIFTSDLEVNENFLICISQELVHL